MKQEISELKAYIEELEANSQIQATLFQELEIDYENSTFMIEELRDELQERKKVIIAKQNQVILFFFFLVLIIFPYFMQMTFIVNIT